MDGVLSIDSEGLTSAAANYRDAASKYEIAMKDLVDKLQNVENNWSDAAVGEWKARIDTIKTNLESVKKRLDLNAKILEDIATEVSATEGNVKKAVNEI